MTAALPEREALREAIERHREAAEKHAQIAAAMTRAELRKFDSATALREAESSFEKLKEAEGQELAAAMLSDQPLTRTAIRAAEERVAVIAEAICD